MGAELLGEHADLDVIGDKGYRSEPVATALRAARGILVRTLPRRNELEQLPAAPGRLLNAMRQIVETVSPPVPESPRAAASGP